MKKLFLLLVLILVAIAAIGAIAWTRRSSIAAGILHKHLGVPVAIEALEINKSGAQISNLRVDNPRGYKSASAFTAQSISIAATYSQITSNPLTIDQITMSDLVITLETKADGETNWKRITSHTEQKPSNRHWLLKTLILRNLTVQVIPPNGTMKTYNLDVMEFHDLSDETGFPADEIEKAIFNQVMKELFQKLNLQKLLQPLVPGGFSIPSLF